MLFPLIGNPVRPNRYDYPTKNVDYDRDMGRYYIGLANNPVLMQNMMTFTINSSMYANDQWIFREDLENFFMEEGGDTNTRIKMRLNIFRNIVKTYVNNVNKNTFQVRAFNISERNMESMNQEMAMRMGAHQLSHAMPDFQDRFKAQYNLGDTPEETEMNFYAEQENKTDNATNALIKRAERMYQFSQWKGALARQKCLGGFACIKDWYRNGEQELSNPDIPYCFYDVNAMKPDLSDAQYAGDIRFTTYTEICEQYPKLSETDKVSLERFSKTKGTPLSQFMLRVGNYPSDRIPVITVTWMDLEVRKYAFSTFMGKPKLMRIDNLDAQDQPQMIDPSELSPEQLKMINGRGEITIEKQVPRFAEIVCKEMISGIGDIVLDHGEVPYNISKKDAPFQSSLPYMYDTYDYFYGRMLTPLDTALDCQRIMNRFASMMEATLNNAIGTGIILSTALTRKDGGKRNSITADLKNSRTVEVDSARTGFNIQNNVIPYSGEASVRSGMEYMNVISAIKAMGEQITSVNSDMTGFNNNPRQLVGVQDNNIQQGFMLQGDFVDGIAYLYYKLNWSIANRGRRIACENNMKLIDTVGTSMAQVFQFTKQMASDAIHIDLRRVPLDYTNIELVDAKLLQYMQLGLIGPNQFGKLAGRAEMDDLYDAISEWQQQQQQSGKELTQQHAQMQQQADQKQNSMIQLDQFNKSQDIRSTQMLQDKKNHGAVIRDLIKSHTNITKQREKNQSDQIINRDRNAMMAKQKAQAKKSA